MHPLYHETVETLRTWAQHEQTVHGAVLLGSQVRTAFEGDEWSDLDILLLVDDPSEFLHTTTWLTTFGETVCVILEETPLQWLQLTWAVTRVLFADNRALDFSILPFDRLDDVLSLNAEIHAQGYHVVYDAQTNVMASQIAETAAAVKAVPPKPPTEEELRRTVDDLLFHLIWACKKIKRNEVWVAVRCLNQQITTRLLQLIEFHTASGDATSQPIRYDGRLLESRIEPEVLEKLSQCVAKYDADDAIQTVRHVLDVTSWLSHGICQENRYSFNASQFATIRTLYEAMFGHTSS